MLYSDKGVLRSRISGPSKKLNTKKVEVVVKEEKLILSDAELKPVETKKKKKEPTSTFQEPVVDDTQSSVY